MNLRDSGLREGYDPRTQAAPSGFIPSDSSGEPLPPLPGIPGERAIPMPSAAPIIVPEGGAFSSRRATPRTAPAPVARDSRLPRLEGPTASSARFRDPALSRTSAGKAKAAVVKPRTPANEPAAPTAKGRAGFLSRLRGGS